MPVTVLRPEVRIPGYFNRKMHTFLLVKVWGAFALVACGEDPGAWSTGTISPRPGTAAGVCSLPPHLAPRAGGLGPRRWSVEPFWDSQTFPLAQLPPRAIFLTHRVAVVYKTARIDAMGGCTIL